MRLGPSNTRSASTTRTAFTGCSVLPNCDASCAFGRFEDAPVPGSFGVIRTTATSLDCRWPRLSIDHERYARSQAEGDANSEYNESRTTHRNSSQSNAQRVGPVKTPFLAICLLSRQLQAIEQTYALAHPGRSNIAAMVESAKSSAPQVGHVASSRQPLPPPAHPLHH